METIHKLSNGLTVIISPMDWLHSAMVGVWVKAGSRSEFAENNGVAHFLEHMSFKGTTTRTAKEIAATIESRGGRINAYTSTASTAYHARVLAQDIPIALDHIADIVNNSIYDVEGIESERRVILEEIKRSQDDPAGVAFEALRKVMYPNHPMGRTTLGSTESVKAMNRDAIVRFKENYYKPSNMIIGVAGPVNADEFIEQVETLFGGLVDDLVVPPTPATYSSGMAKKTGEIEQANVFLGYEGRSTADPKLFALKIAIEAIGGGMSTKLFQEVREKRGLCYTIQANHMEDEDTGGVYIYSGTSANKVDELSTTVSDIIGEAGTTITQAEVDQAKLVGKASFLMGLESASGKLINIVSQYRARGHIWTIDEMADMIDAISLDDVRSEFVRLSEGEITYSVYGPEVGTMGLIDLKEHLTTN